MNAKFQIGQEVHTITIRSGVKVREHATVSKKTYRVRVAELRYSVVHKANVWHYMVGKGNTWRTEDQLIAADTQTTDAPAQDDTPKGLTTGTIVNLGPKGSSNRAHRITNIETIRPTAQGTRKVTLVCISDGTTWTTIIKPAAKRVTWNARMNRVITDAEREQSIETEALKIIHSQGEMDSTRINHSTLYRLSAKGLVYVSRHYPNGTYDVALTAYGYDLITGQTDDSAQDSDTITVSDLADEYNITIQDVTRALDDDNLTEHDGVDAGMARDILNRQRIQIGQIWTSNAHGTDHQVTDYAGNGLWEITGPVGNTYVTSAYDLRSRNTLDMTRFNHPTT